MTRRGTSVRGALAGSVAAAVWAAQQPLDSRLFGSAVDDVALLGKLVTRGRAWPLAGLLLHLQNGALLGIVYVRVKPVLPGPPVVRALIVGGAEHLATWPLAGLVDRHHPARGELEPLAASARAFALETWRHLLFACVLGLLEERLNGPLERRRRVPVSSNGRGDIQRAVSMAG